MARYGIALYDMASYKMMCAGQRLQGGLNLRAHVDRQRTTRAEATT